MSPRARPQGSVKPRNRIEDIETQKIPHQLRAGSNGACSIALTTPRAGLSFFPCAPTGSPVLKLENVSEPYQTHSRVGSVSES